MCACVCVCMCACMCTREGDETQIKAEILEHEGLGHMRFRVLPQLLHMHTHKYTQIHTHTHVHTSCADACSSCTRCMGREESVPQAYRNTTCTWTHTRIHTYTHRTQMHAVAARGAWVLRSLSLRHTELLVEFGVREVCDCVCVCIFLYVCTHLFVIVCV
jgi:hypothetical protein